MDGIHSILLSIRLLEERAPELVWVFGAHEDELALVGGEEVVDRDLDPMTELPEAEPEDPRVLLVLLPFL